MVNVFIEGSIVGLCTSLLGSVIMYMFFEKKLNMYKMFISLFIIGFLLHIIFQFFGANKWYCKFGNACNN